MIPIARSAIIEHKKLIEVGIVFDCPLKAAQHINEIWDNLEDWWQSVSVQEARVDWCKKFSYTKEAYLKEWLSTLSKIGRDI